MHDTDMVERFAIRSLEKIMEGNISKTNISVCTPDSWTQAASSPHTMPDSDSFAEKYYEDPPPYSKDPPPYSRHGRWDQVKRLWSEFKWPLPQQLKERGRNFREILRARQELTKAHFQILCLHRKVRKGKLAPEDIERLERISHGRYDAAMDALERYTGRSSKFMVCSGFLLKCN
jgi:hypothetical protein